MLRGLARKFLGMKLVGTVSIDSRTYRFYESKTRFEVEGSENGSPLNPIRGKKYIPIAKMSDREWDNFLFGSRTRPPTDDYKEYLSNKQRVLSIRS